MRAVLDSNVLARATPGKTSAAREVLLLLAQPPHTLITSGPLLVELTRVLQYPRVRALHGLDDAGIAAYVQAVQGAAVVVLPVAPPPVTSRPMSASPSSDRNLLFGILALQLNFIGRDALVTAMHAWVLDKHKPLGQLLQEQGRLAADRRLLLEALVEEHLLSSSCVTTGRRWRRSVDFTWMPKWATGLWGPVSPPISLSARLTGGSATSNLA